jgi:hypothetical protein
MLSVCYGFLYSLCCAFGTAIMASRVAGRPKRGTVEYDEMQRCLEINELVASSKQFTKLGQQHKAKAVRLMETMQSDDVGVAVACEEDDFVEGTVEDDEEENSDPDVEEDHDDTRLSKFLLERKPKAKAKPQTAGRSRTPPPVRGSGGSTPRGAGGNPWRETPATRALTQEQKDEITLNEMGMPNGCNRYWLCWDKLRKMRVQNVTATAKRMCCRHAACSMRVHTTKMIQYKHHCCEKCMLDDQDQENWGAKRFKAGAPHGKDCEKKPFFDDEENEE